MDDNAVRHLHTYFIQLIQRVGTLLRLRQRAVATAFVYFKRTYRKYTFIDLHPLLVLTVSVLLASKVEECEVRCRYIIEALIKACENEREVRHEAKKIRVSYMIQCELFILQAFNLDLIIFHPYRPMLDFARDANVSSQAMDIAWKMINDSYYRTDICFSYPSFLIGLGALCVTCSYTEHDITHWLSNLEDVDFSEVCVQQKQQHTHTKKNTLTLKTLCANSLKR